MFFTHPLPKSKNRRRGNGVPFPSSRIIAVPDWTIVGGHGVLPGKQMRISPLGKSSFGGKKLLLVHPGVGRKYSGSVIPPPGLLPYGLRGWLTVLSPRVYTFVSFVFQRYRLAVIFSVSRILCLERCRSQFCKSALRLTPRVSSTPKGQRSPASSKSRSNRSDCLFEH